MFSSNEGSLMNSDQRVIVVKSRELSAYRKFNPTTPVIIRNKQVSLLQSQLSPKKTIPTPEMINVPMADQMA